MCDVGWAYWGLLNGAERGERGKPHFASWHVAPLVATFQGEEGILASDAGAHLRTRLGR
jgi:hypothetical protein